MNIKQVILAGLMTSAFALPSAAATKAPGSGPNPFSDCGIGAAIFENDVAAAISNVIWDLGTTAVVSATASPETCNGVQANAAAFIMESFDNLLEDTANGEGEHFTALLNILDVPAANRELVINQVRQDMSASVATDEFATQSKVQKAESFYYSVIASAKLS